MPINRLIETLVRLRLGEVPMRIALWNGWSFSLWPGPTGVTVHVPELHSVRFLARASLAALAEGYVEGRLRIEGRRSDLYHALDVLRERGRASSLPTPGDELSSEFHDLWLDRQDRVCRKLELRRRERFLDLSCGGGSLALWAAKHYGVKATGITRSWRQFEHARERVRLEKLDDRCEILFDEPGLFKPKLPFDKVASIGLFEPASHESAAELLRDGGLFLSHDSAVRHVAGFELLEAESLRADTVHTLEHWLERLDANRALAEQLVGARETRSWRAYLTAAAHGFDRGSLTVYETLSAKLSRACGVMTQARRPHRAASQLVYGAGLGAASKVLNRAA